MESLELYLAVSLERNAEQLFSDAVHVHGDVVLVHLIFGKIPTVNERQSGGGEGG